ncbi:hypothetical protein MRB53_015644 [Persea americana]|uniref:Uncharacterized protein n=1 Tax=Persea americana TaxID=3435 RepID=A0ACC2LZW8_PERAE|nr:hypothetical protein MRB53_015644 [Persea americana]
MVIQDQQIGELLSVVLKARKWGDMKGEGIDVGQLQRIWFELITFFFLERGRYGEIASEIFDFGIFFISILV